MTWSFRQGATITYVRDDGQPGPGQTTIYKMVEGWQIELQDEGCVQISNYKSEPSVLMVVPWHRIYDIRSI